MEAPITKTAPAEHVIAALSDASFNPMSPEFRQDPYPAYEALREHDPVHRSPLGFCVITRYDDVVHVLKNPGMFSSTAMGAATIGDGRPVRTIINTDPPQHTQIRNLINRAFTPRMVADLEPRIREITRNLLGRVLASGEMDLVADLATPLPVTIIAEILGVDAERRDDFKRWSNAVVGGFNGATPEEHSRMQQDRAEFWEYFSRALEERRGRPRSDLISEILRAEEQDVRLTPDEIVSFTMLLLIAGNETTTNLLGNAMLALLQFPEQMERVRADPALIPSLVEEALRYDSPVQFLFRLTTEETSLGGVTIPPQTPVVPVYASANRDERRFPAAARFDVTRSAQGHVAFGLGPHFCLGAPLARLEARVAFEELFASTRDIRVAEAGSERIQSMFLRGLSRLQLRFAVA